MHNCFLRVLKDFEITKEEFLRATNLCSSNGGAYYDGKKIASGQKISVMCIQLNIPFDNVLAYLKQHLPSLNEVIIVKTTQLQQPN